jgi:hypothetical protein
MSLSGKILLPVFTVVLMLCFIGCSGTDTAGVIPREPDESVLIDGDIIAESNLQLKKNPGQEKKYSDIYNKTLFNQDRIFIEKEEETAVEPEPTPSRMQIEVPNLELVGTLQTSADKNSYAFIKNAGDMDPAMRNKVRKYEKGEWIGDYLISRIDASRVTLIRGEEIAVLQLKPPQSFGRVPASKGSRQSGEDQSQGRRIPPSRPPRATQQRENPGQTQPRQLPPPQQQRNSQTREETLGGSAGERFSGRGRPMQRGGTTEIHPPSGARGATSSSSPSGRPGSGR